MVVNFSANSRSEPRFPVPQTPKWTVYAIGLVPAVWYFSLGMADHLGADPLKVLERALGLWSLRFLIFGLAITPVRQSLGLNFLRYRRTIGLLAFYYAALHLFTYVLLDQGLDLHAVWADILKRPFITIGMLSFSLLVPLAITSNNAMIRRLGGQIWSKLHCLVFVAVPAAAVHFILVVKAWPPEPLVHAALVVLLLAYRLVGRASVSKIERHLLS